MKKKIFILLAIVGLLLFSLLVVFHKNIPIIGQVVYSFQRYTPTSAIKNEYDGQLSSILFDCKREDIGKIVGLVEKGANPNFIPKGGKTPLICLARSGNLYAAEKLIQLGAKVNQKNRFIDDSPLLSAADCLRYDMVKLLLEKGADPNITDNTGETALMKLNSRGPNPEQFYDIEIKIAKLLVENGANVNHICHAINCISSSEGSTPLLEASRYNNSEFINFLLYKGANVNAKNKTGWSPLIVAIKSGHYNIAEILINNGADVNVRDKLSQNQNLLEMVALGWSWNKNSFTDNEQVRLCNLLIDKGINADITDQYGFTPLMQAVSYGNPKLVEALIKKGANANAKNKGDNTPIMFLGMTKAEYDKDRPSVEENNQIIKTLIDNDADINNVNKQGENALSIAIENNQIEAAKALIENGIDINLKMPDDTTILTKAIEKKQDDLVNLLISKGAKTKNESAICSSEMITMAQSKDIEIGQKLIELIKNGANYNCTDKEGNNLLSYAVQEKNYNLTDFLIKKGVNVNQKNKKEQTPLMFANDLTQVDLLIRNKANINTKDKNGTPLMMYIKDPVITELLIKKGLNIETKDKNGKTLLMHATSNNNFPLIEKLVELGANINNKDNNGKTPLMLINTEDSNNDYQLHPVQLKNYRHYRNYSSGSCYIYKYLMDKGADINAKDNEGHTANYWAKKNDCDLIEIQKSPELYTYNETDNKEIEHELDKKNILEVRKGIDENTEVHYIGSCYNNAITTIDLKVTIKNKPIVLFLADTGTITWNISMDKDVILKKIIIDNYDKVVFKNKNSNTIITQLTRTNSQGGVYYGNDLDNFLDNSTYVEGLTGKKPKTYQGDRYKKSFIIDGKNNEQHPELNDKNVFLVFDNDRIIDTDKKPLMIGPKSINFKAHFDDKKKLSSYSSVKEPDEEIYSYLYWSMEKEAFASKAYDKGKWYFEAKLLTPNKSTNSAFGTDICIQQLPSSPFEMLGLFDTYGSYEKYKNNDLFGVALDYDNKKVYFSRNGIWQNGLPNEKIGGYDLKKDSLYRIYLKISAHNTNQHNKYNPPDSWMVNFGTFPFKNKPPKGYKAYNEGK